MQLNFISLPQSDFDTPTFSPFWLWFREIAFQLKRRCRPTFKQGRNTLCTPFPITCCSQYASFTAYPRKESRKTVGSYMDHTVPTFLRFQLVDFHSLQHLEQMFSLYFPQNVEYVFCSFFSYNCIPFRYEITSKCTRCFAKFHTFIWAFYPDTLDQIFRTFQNCSIQKMVAEALPCIALAHIAPTLHVWPLLRKNNSKQPLYLLA